MDPHPPANNSVTVSTLTPVHDEPRVMACIFFPPKWHSLPLLAKLPILNIQYPEVDG